MRTYVEQWTPARDAREISREKEAHKRVAIYGIQFSADNRTVVEANSLILGEVLKYLKTNTGVSIEVDGHKMSNDGSPKDDLEITKLRADAIVKSLEAHGIAAGRLHAEGLGRSNPLTESDTSSEIQRNERIEIAGAPQ